MNHPLKQRLEALLRNTDLDLLKLVAEKFYQWDAADQQEAAVEQRNPDYSVADFVFDHLRKEVAKESDLTVLKEQIADAKIDDLAVTAVATAVEGGATLDSLLAAVCKAVLDKGQEYGGGELTKDNDGQYVFYTGLMEKDGKVVPFVSEDDEEG